MADYVSSFTGTQIESKLNAVADILTNISTMQGQISTLQSQVSSLQTQCNDISSLTSRISAAETDINILKGYETTSVNVKGATLNFVKIGRLVFFYANSDTTASWATGTNNAINLGLGDRWMPVYAYQAINMGLNTGSKFITINGSIYHSNGDSFSSGKRLRIYGSYISKE